MVSRKTLREGAAPRGRERDPGYRDRPTGGWLAGRPVRQHARAYACAHI